MNMLNLVWPDLIYLALAYVPIGAAISGKFYTHGRSARPKLIASVRSAWARFSFLALGVGFLLWAVLDLRSKWGV